MDFETVRDTWCVIATPYRLENTVSTVGERSRTATGEKGLGRLSAARLGRTLDIVTKTQKRYSTRLLTELGRAE